MIERLTCLEILVELVDSLKYKQIALPITETAFLTLYEEFMQARDYSASLRCLMDFGLFQGYCHNNLQAIKVLFFAEKRAASATR